MPVIRPLLAASVMRRFPPAMSRCLCPEQEPWTTAGRPYEVEVCASCDGVVAVWQRCPDRCWPRPMDGGSGLPGSCESCERATCALCAGPVANGQDLCRGCQPTGPADEPSTELPAGPLN